MKMISFSGGLGDQIEQYLFKRCMELYLQEELLVDTAFYLEKPEHNNFELDKVFPNINLNFLKNHFSKEQWEIALPNLAQVSKQNIAMEDLGFPEMLFVKTSIAPWLRSDFASYYINSNSFHNNKGNPSAISYYEDIAYSGFRIMPDNQHIDIVKELALEELAFPPITDNKNKAISQQILETHSVAVHIRRGDFVSLNRHLEGVLYQQPINEIRNIIKSNNNLPYFFVFSDDLEWCKNNTEELGFLPNDNIIFIEGNNVDQKNYIDMQLISQTKYIISNKRSSFSRMASFLNRNLIKQIMI